MPLAFLLINAATGTEKEVLEALQKIEAVKEAYIVTGVYDIVAKVKANSMDTLKQTITWHMRRLNGIRSTTTMVVADQLPELQIE